MSKQKQSHTYWELWSDDCGTAIFRTKEAALQEALGRLEAQLALGDDTQVMQLQERRYADAPLEEIPL